MKINALEEIRNGKSLLSHIILECLNQAALESIASGEEYKKSGSVNIVVTVNGHDADLMQLVNNWQSQVEEIIDRETERKFKAEIERLITDKLADISELAEDLESRIMSEIELRKEDWEK